MKKPFYSMILLVFILLFTSYSVVADSVRYVFDEVIVHYAAEFIVYPVNVEDDNWLVELAGGKDKAITVLLGNVSLINHEQSGFTEQFIKVTGINGSERFLVNSGSYDNVIKSFFWSAKKLENNEVIKDFSGPIKSLTLFRYPNGESDYDKIILYASNDGQKAGEEFWFDNPEINIYEADLFTLFQAGQIK